MRAVVLTKTCPAEDLRVSEVPVPVVKPGWVLVKVRAFGLNRSEVILRRHEADAPYIQLPRIPGIECAGVVADPSDSRFRAGQRVVALMGGMGRSFDGSYAEYALLPAHHVFTVDGDWDWVELAAIPETWFTAWGSLFEGLQLSSQDILYIHGGTSALGLAAMQNARSIGCTVLSTTRNVGKLDFLRAQGASLALLDDETLVDRVRAAFPSGVTKALELVWPMGFQNTAKLLKHRGIACVTGGLAHESPNGFDPIKGIPNGAYLTSFYSNFPTQAVMDEIFAHMRAHRLKPVVGRVFPLEKIAGAHLLMEQNEANGKIVVQVAMGESRKRG